METFVGLVGLIGLVAVIVGIAKPDIFRFKSRGMAALVLIGAYLILSIILGSLLPDKPTAQVVETEAPSAPTEQKTAEPVEQPQTPPPAVKSFEEIFSATGKGNSNTDSFVSSGGRLKMVARTWGARVGSYSAFELKAENSKWLQNASINVSTDGTEEGNGETIIRGADSGSYYVQVISGVNWEIKVYEEK